MAPVSVSGSLRRLGMCEGHAPQPACCVLSGKRKGRTPEGYETSPPLRQTAPCRLLSHGASLAPMRHTGTPTCPRAWGRRLHPHGAFTTWISEVVIRSQSCALSTLELPRSLFYCCALSPTSSKRTCVCIPQAYFPWFRYAALCSGCW